MLSYTWCFGQINPDSARIDANNLSAAGNFMRAADAYEGLYHYWEDIGVQDSAYFYKYKELHHLGQAGMNKACTDQLETLVSTFEKTGNYPRFSSQIFYSLGSNYLYQSEFESALKFLDRVVEFEENQTDTDTIYIAKALEWKGLTNIYAGDMAKAAELVEKAVSLHVSALGNSHKELGYTLNSLALIYDELDLLEKADSAFGEAFRILSLHLPPEHAHLSSVSANISSIKVELGDFDGARSMLEKAIEIHRKQNLLAPLLKEYFNLGTLYLALDDTRRGIPYVEKAMAIADSLLPTPHTDRVNLYNGLGTAYYLQGDYYTADSLYSMGLKENLLLNDSETAQLGQSYYNLGMNSAAKEQFKLAEKFYSKSYEIRRASLGETHPSTADAFYGMAEVLINNGNRKYGISMMKRCLEYYIDAYGYSHQSVVESALFLARDEYQNSSDHEIWKELLDRTWAYVYNQDPVDFDFYTAKDISFLDPYVLSIVEFQLETIAAEAGSARELLAVMDKMKDLMGSLWPLLNFENTNSPVLRQIHRIYNLSALISHRLNRASPDVTLQNIMLEALQESRFATIRSTVQNRSAMQFANVPDSLVETDRLLREKLQFIRAKGAQGDAEYWKELEFEHIESWRDFQRSMKERYPKWYKLRYQERETSLTDIQNQLHGSALLGFCYLDSVSIAVVVNENSFASFEMDTRGISEEIQTYRNLIESQASPDELAEPGYHLFKKLVAPYFSELSANVMIMPDGPLNYINFESIPSELPVSGNWSDWNWLLKTHEIIAVNELPTSDERSSTASNTLVFAPGFSNETKAAYAALVPQNAAVDTLYQRWVRTPWSERFAEELSGKGQSFTGLEAHKKNFREHSAKAGLLHFGTHAVMNDIEPLKSFLALTPRPDMDIDGCLYAHELYNQPISAGLAVLTACETGVGAYSDGEGVLSLAYAFQYAGCPNVMYSLWKIDDEQSTEIARSFYQKLESGKRFSTALREAKLEYMTNASGELASPYYWSGIVIAGSNGKVASDGFWSQWLVFLIAGGAVVLFGVIAIRMRLRA
ncbi:MAG: CHAT domain-containing protein [Cryomorphaceae bacterium]